MHLPIKRTIERLPGGMMIVPLFAGALITTTWPGIGQYFGSFTGALFSGPLPILAVFYVCLGSTIELRATPYILKKGGALFGAKVLTGLVLGFVAGRYLGESPVPAGAFAGISTLAIVAAVNDTNGGLYMALMGQFGQPRDVAAYSIMSIESGPFLTMVTLGVAGLSAFPWQTLVGAVLPLVVGLALGNLDSEMRAFLARAVPVLIPFFAFALGAGINLTERLAGGSAGTPARSERGAGQRHRAHRRRQAHRGKRRGGNCRCLHRGERRRRAGDCRQREPRVCPGRRVGDRARRGERRGHRRADAGRDGVVGIACGPDKAHTWRQSPAGARLMRTLVGIVADDLTGAADTAVAFLAAGGSAVVSWPGRAVERAWASLAAGVLAVNTRSRVADAGVRARHHERGRVDISSGWRGHAVQEDRLDASRPCGWRGARRDRRVAPREPRRRRACFSGNRAYDRGRVPVR